MGKQKSWKENPLYLQSRGNVPSVYRQRVKSLPLHIKCRDSSFLLEESHVRPTSFFDGCLLALCDSRPASSRFGTEIWSQCSTNMPSSLSPLVPPPQIHSDEGLQGNKTLQGPNRSPGPESWVAGQLFGWSFASVLIAPCVGRRCVPGRVGEGSERTFLLGNKCQHLSYLANESVEPFPLHFPLLPPPHF